ncbi:MAG: DoxX family membrane protein [Candidatus Pacebacteria bacterium]|nr:DoxX family membrane protein [Candidatus Paceibacterota bacterium]
MNLVTAARSFGALLVGTCATLFTFPAVAAAHTRWFAEGTLQPYITMEPTGLYLMSWAIIAAVIVAIGVYLEHKKLFQLNWLKPRLAHSFDRAAGTFSMVAGAFFIVAGTHEYLFSPNMEHAMGVPSYFIIAQVFIGLAFLVGVYARVAALALIALWALSVAWFGWLPMLENVWVLGTGLFVLIMGNDYFSVLNVRVLKKYTQHYHAYALPLLRICTGATLMVLGFSEKILHPEFGINFLEQHHWNFMQLIGFTNYSDYLFTLSAGSVEALFGLVFILGIVTRVNALVVATFFTIPLFILGPIELAGHLPHFAAVIMLLLFGSGEKFVLIPRVHRIASHLRPGAYRR